MTDPQVAVLDRFHCTSLVCVGLFGFVLDIVLCTTYCKSSKDFATLCNLVLKCFKNLNFWVILKFMYVGV